MQRSLQRIRMTAFKFQVHCELFSQSQLSLLHAPPDSITQSGSDVCLPCLIYLVLRATLLREAQRNGAEGALTMRSILYGFLASKHSSGPWAVDDFKVS